MIRNHNHITDRLSLTISRGGLLAALCLSWGCSSDPAPPDAPIDAGIETDAAPEVDATPLPPPLFSHERGFYDSAFDLVLSPDAGVEAYVTTDGRDPTGPTATLYDGPLAIERTTVVRVAFQMNEQSVGDPVTHTYILPHTVPDQQAPAGYPDMWWGAHGSGPWPADYEVDPEVTGSASAAHMFPRTFYELPSVSVSLDPDDLFGVAGVHEFPWMLGDEWERAGSLEVLKHERRENAQIDCGVRVFGDSLSRSPSGSPKKSFRLVFDATYGPDALEYDLFEDSSAFTAFSTLILHAGYQRTWLHPSTGSRSRAQYVREPFAVASQRDMGHLGVRTRHVHLFLNGLYWGLYNVQERPDAAFLAARLGGEPSEYDVIDTGTAVDGDEIAWEQMMAIAETDLSDPGAYQSLGQWIDLENFADFVVLEQYLGDTDWADGSWFAGRQRTPEGRFLFFNWDAESGYGESTTNVIDDDEPDSPARVFQQLRANPEFVMLFADRVQKHLFDGGALTPAHAIERWNDLSKQAEAGVYGESARWGDHVRDVRGNPEGELYLPADFWFPEDERITDDVLSVRTGHIVEQFRAAGLYPTVDAPLLERHGGEVPVGFELSMLVAGPARTLYYTTDGSDPRLAGGTVAPGVATYSGPIAITQNVTLSARTRTDAGEWSARVVAAFTVR